MIICLESAEEDAAGYILSQNIELAEQTEDPDLIEEIRQLWDGESWESILRRSKVEGSVWYVWWMDGVRKFLDQAMREAALRPCKPSPASPQCSR